MLPGIFSIRKYMSKRITYFDQKKILVQSSQNVFACFGKTAFCMLAKPTLTQREVYLDLSMYF